MEAKQRREDHLRPKRRPLAPLGSTSITTISVIEPAEPRATPFAARPVPFGFARALEDTPPAEDDGWGAHAIALMGYA